MPAGTVLEGCSLCQSRTVFKCVTITSVTRASFAAALSWSDPTHSVAFFSTSESDLVLASGATVAGGFWAAAESEMIVAINSARRPGVFIRLCHGWIDFKKEYSAGALESISFRDALSMVK